METLSVSLGERSYSIYIDEGLMERIPHLLDEIGLRGLVVLVTDDRVNDIYGADLASRLRETGRDTHILEVPQGEPTKTLRWAESLYDRLISLRADRTTLMLALGGGVVGDLTGFVAATYMRGLPYVQVPTTLLAQVDSSVGGKTAVNHPKGKNIIGAFYQPRAVFIDIRALSSLPEREFLSGLAEVVKYGVISDKGFFHYIRDNLSAIKKLDKEALTSIVERSCAIKAEVVAKDERESGLRAILNFGHTIGHAVESLTGYQGLKHGECVSIGMACAARLSERLGLCARGEVTELVSLLDSTGLPTELPGLSPEDVLAAMVHDKKVMHGRLRLVLMERLGKVVIKEGLDEEVILQSLS
jgi:3-dehydroquinate synthase